MSEPSKVLIVKKRPSKLDAEIDDLLDERDVLTSMINQARAKEQKAIAKATKKAAKKFKKKVGKSPKKLEALDQQITVFAVNKRRSLWRRHSKTIKRPSGELRYVVRAAELVLPKDVAPVIAKLMEASGEKYLRKVYEIDRRALLQASSEEFAPLRPLGVYRGRRLHIMVRSTTDKGLTTLTMRPYNPRPPKEVN